jgi:hypothetical protein
VTAGQHPGNILQQNRSVIIFFSGFSAVDRVYLYNRRVGLGVDHRFRLDVIHQGAVCLVQTLLRKW